MKQLAENLMFRERGIDKSALPSAIFGSVSGLSQSINIGRNPVRIALYPFVGVPESLPAHGIGILLGLLLERWQDVTVYRLCAKLEGDANEYQWKPELSTFGPDDWEIEGLDTNVVITGKLDNASSGELSLVLSVEQETATGELHTFSYSYANYQDLIAALPTVCQGVAEFVGARRENMAMPLYEGVADLPTEWLQNGLESIFRWELSLFLALWKDTPGVDLLPEAEKLLSTLDQNDFGLWVAFSSLQRLLNPMLVEDLPALLVNVQGWLDKYSHAPIAAIVLSPTLYKLALRDEALELVARATEKHSNNPHVWLTRVQIERTLGRVKDAVKSYQSAISNDIEHVSIYVGYASLLLTIDFSYDITEIEEFILVDEDEEDNPIVEEAIEAYYNAIEVDPHHLGALQGLIIQLIDVVEDVETDDEIWPLFATLVEHDSKGDRVRDVVDNLYDLDDYTLALQPLLNKHAASPERVDVMLSIGALYIEAEEYDKARSILRKAQGSSITPEALADVEELLLNAEFPNFTERFTDLRLILDTGKGLSPDDVAFLETVVEKSPNYVDGALRLAQAYLAWDEDQDALDVLMNTLERRPNDPDLLEMVASLLWQSEERELAFKYLDRGLDQAPNHLPLLIRTAEYLLEVGEMEKVKYYMARAQTINSRHLRFKELQAKIARLTD